MIDTRFPGNYMIKKEKWNFVQIYWVLLMFMGHVGSVNAQARNSTALRLLTFNAGLTPRVGQYDVRRKHIGASINNQQADIVCLQEVWYSDDMTRIIESTKEMYPYSYSAIHREVGELTPMSNAHAPCLSAEFATVMSCVVIQCHATNGTLDYLTCARDTCGMLKKLDQSCITCLIITGFSNLAERCVGDLGTGFNVPGILLLSKIPLKNVRFDMFVPRKTLFLPRGYITTEVQNPTDSVRERHNGDDSVWNDVDEVGTVICAHTTANLDYGNFEALGYKTWEEQNAAEARILVQYLRDKSKVVVMGDLNSSPLHASTDVTADMPGMYEYFTASGYMPSYMDHLGICSWCEYNPIAQATHNLVLDHVLVKNLTVLSVRRVFDELLPHKGFPLSDHYGIEARLARNPSFT